MVHPPKNFQPLLLVLGAIILIVLMLICTTIGPASITLSASFWLLIAKIPLLGSLVDISGYPDQHLFIVENIRMPRVILAVLVGAALAAVGTTFQGLFKNPMADPYIIGVSSGAALGAAIAIVFGSQGSIINFWLLPLAAFIGALMAIFIVYQLASSGGRVPVYTLLLSGVALSAFTGSITSLIMISHTSEMQQIMFWMLGSFSGKGWPHVKIAFPLITLGILGLCYFARDLNVMLFGEDTAQHLGIDTEKLKKILLVLSALTVAAAVAVSGTIGFVGLIIPHIVRLVVGPDHRFLLPAAVLTGAGFMLFTDTLARTVLAPTEIPVGIITAFFGGPFFIYLLRKNKTGL